MTTLTFEQAVEVLNAKSYQGRQWSQVTRRFCVGTDDGFRQPKLLNKAYVIAMAELLLAGSESRGQGTEVCLPATSGSDTCDSRQRSDSAKSALKAGAI